MAIPATGTTWDAGHYSDRDSRLFERGGTVAVAVRDYRGANTNISPSVFSPFATDGKVRDDLWAVQLVNGSWTVNTNPNEGWWNLGAFSERNGPERRPNIRKDDYMILQSGWPYDSDIISEGETVRLTPVDTLKPAIARLRNNKPFLDAAGSIIVESPGATNYFIGKAAEAEQVERQIMIMRKRTKGGLEVLTAEAFALAKLDDIGNQKKDKQAADASELGFTGLPDPYFVDLDGTPLVTGKWVAGSGWYGLSVPVFPGAAPVGTAGTTGKAQIVFTNPTGPTPITFTGEKSTDGGTTWTAGTPDGANWAAATTSTGGNTTLKFASLAVGATKLRAVATGANGTTATSQASNSVTVT